MHSWELPVPLRPVFIGLYAKLTGCDMSEAKNSDYKSYRNIGDFFRRELKPDIRPIDETSCLVSPADGKVLLCGKMPDGSRVEQVKGINYSVSKFLGPITWADEIKRKYCGDDLMMKCGQSNNHTKTSCLYECVIYLAPGDYHRFHSPAAWDIKYRRHFPGNIWKNSSPTSFPSSY
jgi:phosphatidylserine decarboxylase